jgi:hypothetical protein
MPGNIVVQYLGGAGDCGRSGQSAGKRQERDRVDLSKVDCLWVLCFLTHPSFFLILNLPESESSST